MIGGAQPPSRNKDRPLHAGYSLQRLTTYSWMSPWSAPPKSPRRCNRSTSEGYSADPAIRGIISKEMQNTDLNSLMTKQEV